MDIFEKEKKYFLNVYKRFPIDVDKGRGVYLYDKNGLCYLDFLAGIAVNALGYNHPDVLAALKKQMNRNLHLSNFFIQDIQVELAAKLIELTPFSKIFFTNSGTEAIEGLIKLIKKWGLQQEKNEIIAFQGSFHGRSLGSLSITMQEKYQKNFQPLLSDIKTVPFNNVEKFNQSVNEKTIAVFYEGITGEGGVHPVSTDMLNAMKRGREKYGYLLIADEIQTGVGRTGKFYYFENTNVIPDAIASAKGIGGGLPLGCFLVNQLLDDVFNKGEHGTTCGGNPLACAAGLATVNKVSDILFLKKIDKTGRYFKNMLYEIQNEFNDIVVDIRGKGLMLGMEVRRDAVKLMETAFRQGLLFNLAGGDTLRFIPPLIVEKSEIDEAVEKLRLTFKQVFR
jgi:predicted acetylornithine/succinylornithine family transaminase